MGKPICFIQELGANLAVNPLHLGYNNQSFSAV